MERTRDTADRRRVMIELTPKVRERAEEIWGPIAAEANETWSRYSDEELALLHDFLVTGREFLGRHLERIASTQ